MAGYTLHPDRHIFEKQRLMAQALSCPIIWGTSPSLEGRSLSVARDAKVPAIYCEYLGSAICHPDGVEDYVDGCLNVMGHLEMIERQVVPSRVKHCVEDHRTGSGYIQVQDPAPQEGYFEPHVELGDSVAPGDLLGTVCDELGESTCDVISNQFGTVSDTAHFSPC